MPWLEDEDTSSTKFEVVKSFYSSLWGTTPTITVPFFVTCFGHKALDIREVFQTIRVRDINAPLTSQGTTSPPGLTVYKGNTLLDMI